MADYKSEVVVKTGREEVFEFFLRPENVREVTLPELKLTFLEAPDRVQAGSTIEFEVTHLGQSLKATHEVTEASDFCIAEKQVSGAMKSWVHRRTFEAISDSECRISNEITFEGPGGLVGVIMNEDRIRGSLDKGFAYQNAELQQRFGRDAA